MPSVLEEIEAFWVDLFYNSKSNSILPSGNRFSANPPTPSFLRTKSFTIRTSDSPLSGYILLGNKAIFKSPILTNITMTTFVTLRPKNQTGPFPEGLIKIVPISECDSEYCNGMCLFIGDVISEVDVKEVLPSGAEIDVPSKRDSRPFMNQGHFWTHFRVLEWYVTTRRSTFTYRCSAFDWTHGTGDSASVTIRT
ncbi:hypothetical protein PoB_001161100 [Plakobranchus ocellatus]|uniref:Uncharacterized protein n=1 Tax=Plakobranchus ocellatus TaxID=259542 RepID=A0AAV3YRU9_9GAST|nr:hypothetical protein PoB_001161100 [Plakobranchus ocellatus]